MHNVAWPLESGPHATLCMVNVAFPPITVARATLTRNVMVNVARPPEIALECDVDQVAGPTALQARRSPAPEHPRRYVEPRAPRGEETVSQATSRDGTAIAFDRMGEGPPLVLVDGALSHRGLGPMGGLADALAADFAVYRYDRRGRGESGDTAPYAVAREVEDLEAVIAQAGGAAAVFGISSGGALALEAAAERTPGHPAGAVRAALRRRACRSDRGAGLHRAPRGAARGRRQRRGGRVVPLQRGRAARGARRHAQPTALAAVRGRRADARVRPRRPRRRHGAARAGGARPGAGARGQRRAEPGVLRAGGAGHRRGDPRSAAPRPRGIGLGPGRPEALAPLLREFLL